MPESYSRLLCMICYKIVNHISVNPTAKTEVNALAFSFGLFHINVVTVAVVFACNGEW